MNKEVNHRLGRKMAAHRCSQSAWLFLLFSLSVFLLSDSQETTLTDDNQTRVLHNQQPAAEAAKPKAEHPAAEERRWEATDVKEAIPDDAADHKQDTSASNAAVLTSVPQPKDDFQEELAIRPLHSGDIYASFQFRTLWETDFMRGNKGKLADSNE